MTLARCWLVLALSACATSKPTPPSEPKDLDARTMHLGRRALDDPNSAAIEGRIYDVVHKEPAVGATVVADPPRRPVTVDESGHTTPSLAERMATQEDEFVRVSDDNGNYILDVPPGTYRVTLYYNNVASSVTGVEVVHGFATRLDLVVDRDVPVRAEPLHIR
jgi:hypothetical protein